MNSRSAAVPVVALVLAGLLLVLALVVRGGPAPGDEALAQAVAGQGGALLALISRLASVPLWTALVLIVGAWLWRLVGPRPALLLLLGDLSAEAVAFLVKALVDRPRPVAGPLEDMVMTASFPSGHVVRATVVLGLLLALLVWRRPGLRLPATLASGAFLLVLGVARVASGEHWPSDALGGYLLGSAWCLLALQVARPALSAALPASGPDGQPRPP